MELYDAYAFRIDFYVNTCNYHPSPCICGQENALRVMERDPVGSYTSHFPTRGILLIMVVRNRLATNVIVMTMIRFPTANKSVCHILARFSRSSIRG